MHKLGIIVPYRNRKEQLDIFKKELPKFLKDQSITDYSIIVVDQIDKKQFNRGKLLNIGYLEAEKLGCDYVIFHDVDMLPIEVDYSYEDKPLQLANKFKKDGEFNRVIQRNYFGGVTLFPVKDFKLINGYSNKYKGWGFEDDDLLLRCREVNLKLESEPYRGLSMDKPTLYLTGKNSYIQMHNIYRTIRPFSLIATFYPDPIDCNPSEITDEYTIFSIPGHDMNISFNSFSRYKFELFLKDNTPVSLTSDFLPPLPVQVVVNINPRNRRIDYYINGKLVEEKYWGKEKIRLYEEEPYVYFGVADPNRKEKPKFFKGYLSNIGILHGELSKEEVKKLYLSNPNERLVDTNEHLKSRWNGYWDSLDLQKDGYTLKDTSGYNNNAWLKYCLIEDIKTSPVVRIKFPYRREGTFQLLKHEEAGYTDGFWKDWSSRENQLRYYRRANSRNVEMDIDGLSSCNFRERNREESTNYIKIEVIT